MVRPTRAVRGLLAAVMVVLTAACTDGAEDPELGQAAATTTTSATVELPPPARAFLGGADPATVTFTATYSVLRKLGGQPVTATVTQSPPWQRLTVDDVELTDGPTPSTCVPSTDTCVDRLETQRLTPVGVFPGFVTAAPREALRTAAGRPGAVLTEGSRTLAGVTLRCLTVAIGAEPTGEWCVTEAGVFAYVDTAVERIQLVAYAPTAPELP